MRHKNTQTLETIQRELNRFIERTGLNDALEDMRNQQVRGRSDQTGYGNGPAGEETKMKAPICTTESTAPASLDFRTQQMLQMADIDGHIRFMQTLIERYSFPSGQKAQLQAELKKIQSRQNEKTLSMAVIGEFSSGKSSFINALLRENLLETDAIQGTTVSSPLIRYNPQKEVCTYEAGGMGKKTQRVDSSEALAKLLKGYTSGEQKNANVQHLEVGYPSDFLQQGICIIDTPGTNSLEQWHEDVTKETIREQTDACIILTSAEKPFPESFCRFLENNLQDVLQTCVFVVTKIDLIPPKQQARQLEYIRKVLNEKLSVRNPLILPYSALPVINGAETEYIEGNRETEEKILKFLQEQRIRIQLQRCISLLEHAMGRLQENMEQISSEQKQKHERLVQAVTTDLESFVYRKKGEIGRLYREAANEKAEEFSGKVDDSIRYRKEDVYTEFFKFQTESDIREFLRAKLKPLLEEKKMEFYRLPVCRATAPLRFLIIYRIWEKIFAANSKRILGKNTASWHCLPTIW